MCQRFFAVGQSSEADTAAKQAESSEAQRSSRQSSFVAHHAARARTDRSRYVIRREISAVAKAFQHLLCWSRTSRRSSAGGGLETAGSGCGADAPPAAVAAAPATAAAVRPPGGAGSEEAAAEASGSLSLGSIARVEHRAAASPFLTDDPSFLSGSPLRHTLLRARLPGSAADAATALFGNASSHSAQVYAATGSTDVWIGDWAPAVLGGGAPAAWIRQVQRRQPVRTKLSPVRSTRVHERHMLVGTADGAQLLIVEQTMLDIPLHDYFTVVIKLCLADDEPVSHQQSGGAGGAGRARPTCKLDVSMEVRFHRSTWFESHIQANTRKELRAYYATAAPLMRACLEERTRETQP